MPPDNPPTLFTDLTAERAAWERLLQTLQDEEQALIAGEADRLALLNTVKLTQLQEVSDRVRNRHAGLLAAGHAGDASGMRAWMAQHPHPALPDLWQQLNDMEQQAQALNQRIGTLIDMRLTSTRQALNVLVHSATSQGGLYDQEGLAVAARRGKPLTAA